MASIEAIEIHTYQNGKWKTDSVYDDRDLALSEVQCIAESGYYTRIRAI